MTDRFRPVRLFLASLLFVASAACTVSRAEVNSANDARFASLKKIAAFDLDSEPAALQVTCLATEGAGYCAKAGVKVEGKQATYVLISASGQPGSARQWVRE